MEGSWGEDREGDEGRVVMLKRTGNMRMMVEWVCCVGRGDEEEGREDRLTALSRKIFYSFFCFENYISIFVDHLCVKITVNVYFTCSK
jgi:hypothetical protein